MIDGSIDMDRPVGKLQAEPGGEQLGIQPGISRPLCRQRVVLGADRADGGRLQLQPGAVGQGPVDRVTGKMMPVGFTVRSQMVNTAGETAGPVCGNGQRRDVAISSAEVGAPN